MSVRYENQVDEKPIVWGRAADMPLGKKILIRSHSSSRNPS